VIRETIQRVIAAEDEAKRLVEAARNEGDALRADYRRRAKELAENTEQELRLAGAKILETVAEDARREREDRIRKASSELEAIIRLDEGVAREAVDAIIRCVCGRGPS
jgi:vacuolar-type H+-ATPase subunit H